MDHGSFAVCQHILRGLPVDLKRLVRTVLNDQIQEFEEVAPVRHISKGQFTGLDGFYGTCSIFGFIQHEMGSHLTKYPCLFCSNSKRSNACIFQLLASLSQFIHIGRQSFNTCFFEAVFVVDQSHILIGPGQGFDLSIIISSGLQSVFIEEAGHIGVIGPVVCILIIFLCGGSGLDIKYIRNIAGIYTGLKQGIGIVCCMLYFDLYTRMGRFKSLYHLGILIQTISMRIEDFQGNFIICRCDHTGSEHRSCDHCCR